MVLGIGVLVSGLFIFVRGVIAALTGPRARAALANLVWGLAWALDNLLRSFGRLLAMPFRGTVARHLGRILSPFSALYERTAPMGALVGVVLAVIVTFGLSLRPDGSAPFLVAYDDSDLSCLALNIYHEARGEPESGKLAVGHVVLNRARDRRFPDRVCDVVRQGGEEVRHGCQFSWWCDGRSDRPNNAVAWQESLDYAGEILDGKTKDPTGGALWYHADYVEPPWSKVLTSGPQIGRHVFYFDRNGV